MGKKIFNCVQIAYQRGLCAFRHKKIAIIKSFKLSKNVKNECEQMNSCGV